MSSRSAACVLGALLVFGLAWAPGRAQATYSTQTAYPSHYPPALPARPAGTALNLALEKTAELHLPGRPTGPPEVVGAEARLPLDQAIAVVTAEADGYAVRIEPAPEATAPTPDPSPEPEWVVSPDGRRRFRCLPEGRIEAEKRRRSGTWKAIWHLRIPGRTLAPPIVLGPRVLFPSHDNRVYCLRADNGHRVWDSDVQDRLSRRLTVWTGIPRPEEDADPAKPQEPSTLILVVPDAGGTLLALDPYDGSRVAVLELPSSEGRLATTATPAPDGRVLVARESYSMTESALLVIDVVPAPPPQAGSSGSRDTLNGPAPKSRRSHH